MTIKRAGTVTFTNGSPAVIGVGTFFSTLPDGALIRRNKATGTPNVWYAKLAHTSDSAMSIEPPWADTTSPGGGDEYDAVVFQSGTLADAVNLFSLLSERFSEMVQLTAHDRTITLNRDSSADNAGIIVQANDVEQFRFGAFGDGNFALLRKVGAAWVTVFTVDGATGVLTFSEGAVTSQLLPRNRAFNGAMRLSQRFGAATTDVTTTPVEVVNAWTLTASGGGTVRAQQIGSITPGGSPNRLRLTAQVADASVAAGDFYRLQQTFKGIEIADLKFGSASAKALTIQFMVNASLAGTYALAVMNAAGTRSRVAEYIISAPEVGVDVVKTVTIPGDTAGAWLTTNADALLVVFDLGSGSNFNATAGVWSAGNYSRTTSVANWIGNAAATFNIGDVAIYAGSVAPTYEVPSYAAEEAVMLRRQKPIVTVTLYVDYNTGDNTRGDGTATKPFKSVSTAAYYYASNYDLSNALAVVQMADNATDLDGLHWAVHALLGAQGGAALTIKGGVNSVLVNAQAYFGAVIRFQDLKLRDGLTVDKGGYCYLGNVAFGTGAAPAAINIGPTAAGVELFGPISFDGINTFAAIICSGATFDSLSYGITTNADQTVSGGWAFSQSGGKINFRSSPITNTHTVTGPKYAVIDGGRISLPLDPLSSATVTISIASPAVVAWNAHGLAADAPVRFTTTGALPTGLVANTIYWVKSPTTNAFNVAAAPGGAAINTSGTQSGVHTASAANPLPGTLPGTNTGGYVDTVPESLAAGRFPALTGDLTTVAGALATTLAAAAITGKTEDTAPDGAADFLLSYDASAAALKKILLHRATAFKAGSFTRNTSTATGTQAVTGVGFKPKAAIFLAVVGSTTKASWGFSDGTTHECLYDYSGVVAGQYNPFGGAVRLITNGSDIYDGVVQSWDSDGFTFSWTKNGAPPSETATIYYIAAR